MFTSPGIEDEDVDLNSPNFANLTAVDQPNEPNAPYLNAEDFQGFEDEQVTNPPAFETGASDALLEHLKNVPMEQQQGFWKRALAGLIGGLASDGEPGGYNITKDILQDPYRKSIERWKAQNIPLQAAATSEDRSNAMLGRMHSQEEYRNYLKKWNKAKFLGDLSETRRKSAESSQKDKEEAEKFAETKRHNLEEESQGRVAETGRMLRDNPPKPSKLSATEFKMIKQKALNEMSNHPNFGKFFKDKSGNVFIDDKGRPAIDYGKMTKEEYTHFNTIYQQIIDRLSKQ